MSTVKADAITAVSTNGDLSLDGLGTGGVSIASTLKMTKGGDIASASPLVIDTDGNYFDVTGTTNFAAMTVESGNFFMLQFDGALTITHGSGIELPGAANLTTATGDRLICYATAANTVEVMSVETEAAASAGLTVSSVTATTSGTTIDFGSIPAGTEMIIINYNDVGTNSTSSHLIQIGDAGGIEASNYISIGGQILYSDASAGEQVTAGFLVMKSPQAAHGAEGQVILTLANPATFKWNCHGGMCHNDGGNGYAVTSSAGAKALSAELTTVRLTTVSGDTFDQGSVNIMYM